ncbi:MAG: phage capsid protein, partial [Thermoleophilia bacterium]|nr:phage capsid protein [Thermoleophilia bacterium]
ELGSNFTGYNRGAVNALARETIGLVTATHTQILRSSVDMYRATISQTMAQVLTGTQTRREAAQAAMDRFAGRGIIGFIDRSGRNWRLESYVEMATRTGAGHAMIEGRLKSYQEDGRDLVIVSDAPEECPVCEPWEGQILSISGKSDEYPSVSEAEAAGLFHPNCRHDVRPYIKGLTKPHKGTADPEGYKEREKQRYHERQVREKKRQVASAKEFGDSALLSRRQTQLAGAQQRLTGFVNEHDRKRLRYREQIKKAI